MSAYKCSAKLYLKIPLKSMVNVCCKGNKIEYYDLFEFCVMYIFY